MGTIPVQNAVGTVPVAF